MQEKYEKIAKLCGLIAAFTKEIELDEDLSESNRYFLIEELMQATAPAQKNIYLRIKKRIEEDAKNNYQDGETNEKDGFKITCKWSKAPTKLDTDKLIRHYSQLLSEFNKEFCKSEYEIAGTAAKKIIIEKSI
jgi:hypothetical protein